MRPTLLALVLVTTALCGVIASRAMAQDTPDALIDRGFDRREAGDDAGGLALFTQAYEQGHSARALAQMGLAEQALGRWVLAEQHVQGALAEATDAWIVAHHDVLADALHTIQARLASLELVGGEAGADVLVDGEVVGQLPLAAPLRLAAGTLQVLVRKEGFLPWAHAVVLQPGETGRESIELRPQPPTPVVETQPPPTAPHAVTPPAPVGDPGGTWRLLGWTSIVVGLGAAVFGSIFLGFREADVDQFNSDACLSTTATRLENCPGKFNEGHQFETASIIGLVAAGALGVLGVVLLVAAPGPPRDSTPPATSLTCGPGPGQIGIGCAGRF